MGRLGTLLFVIVAAGCRLPPEREPLKPLPEDGNLYSYQEILARVRIQASAAVEAFYEDAWTELEEAAKGLQQSSRFLPKTTDQPVHLKNTLVPSSAELGQDAAKLAEAARAKSVPNTTQVLQRITLQIRSLRPKELPERPKADKE